MREAEIFKKEEEQYLLGGCVIKFVLRTKRNILHVGHDVLFVCECQKTHTDFKCTCHYVAGLNNIN